MTPEQYRKAGELYHAALALSAEQRSEYLQRACAGDADLLQEVESLLAAHAAAADFVAAPHEQVNVRLDALVRDHSAEWTPPDESPDTDSLMGAAEWLGRYQVLDLLGTGGMGRVYSAVDLELGREVAIKALGHTFRGDPASLRRFEREARILATLSHPNIATIFGLERFGNHPYLILERVDGSTLAERLNRGAMSVHDAVAVALQIVAGLEEAHGKGVVHRDLKPSNVMLSPDGRVKLVDFGLAKRFGAGPVADRSGEPITVSGVVLGTARYMSPEQVRGEDVDSRTDVWAFGCVLYEMLTGRPAFAGRSVSEVVAAVLRDDPDWSALPATAAGNMRRLLRRCLRRDARLRLQHIGDARLELEDADEPQVEQVGNVSARRWSRTGWTFAAVAVAAAIALAVWRNPSRGVESSAARLSVELPRGLALASEFSAPFAIAPAGSPLVFEAVDGNVRRLYMRGLAESVFHPIAGSEDARQPFFSPDGAWVGFFANRKLAKVPVNGGSVLQLADIGGNPRGASWAPDGTIVVAPTQTSGLVRVPDAGGRPVPLTILNSAAGESSHRWPSVLPGGNWVIFTVGREDARYDEGRIEAVSIATGERRILVQSAGFARYVPEGRLLFVRDGRLYSVGFDPVQVAVHGAPQVAFDAVRYDWRNGGAHLDVSASGALLYTPAEPISSEYFLSWSDRDARLVRASDTPRAFRDIKLSADGRRIAVVVGRSTESDLWVVDDASGTLSRLSFGLSPQRPTWTARGDGITVGAQKDSAWRLVTIPVDGKHDPVVLFESPNRLYPNAWSPDGRSLVFQENRPGTGWDLRVLAVDGSGQPFGEPRALAATPFHEGSASISRDGRWVSYESDELDGVFQVYVRSFPDGAHKVRVSPAGARLPIWDARGNLHYWQTEDDTLQVVQTRERGGQLLPGAAQPVWGAAIAPAVRQRVVITVAGARYDVDPGGARVLVLESSTPIGEPPLSHPMLVLGWR